MSRTTTFANIGIDITGLKTSEEVLNAANLNYNVVKQDMYLKTPDGNFINEVGIEPTNVVEYDYNLEYDNQLEEALKLISDK